MKHCLCKILISSAAIICFSLSHAAQMGQCSDRTREIQKFFREYIRDDIMTANLYDRVKGLECDGVYNPETYEVVIAALQNTVEAHTTGNLVDGWFGSVTEEKCSTVKKGDRGIMVRITQAGLYFNGYVDAPFDEDYSSFTSVLVTRFQAFMKLPTTGTVDGVTMKALLSSGGSWRYPASGCDCTKQLTKEAAVVLRRLGYTHVGRYLTSVKGGLQKHLTSEEIAYIKDAGLRYMVFFQEGKNNEEHCTPERGLEDARKAINAAQLLNIPVGSTIYGVVDADIPSEKALPYLTEMSSLLKGARYVFGVYGSREVCSRAYQAGVSKFSYVAGMPYRWKGNFGYPMPVNWSFNQEYELKLGKNREQVNESLRYEKVDFDLDRVVVSGLDDGIG